MKNRFNWVHGVLIAIIVILFLNLMTVINLQQKLSCNQFDGRNGCESVGAQHYSFTANLTSSHYQGIQWNICQEQFDKKYNVSDMSQNGFCTILGVSTNAFLQPWGQPKSYIDWVSCSCWYLNKTIPA